MREYDVIAKFYGTDTAKRSGVPLINHIREGLIILDEIGASYNAKRAFCLHPMFQSDFDLEHSTHLIGVFDSEVIALVLEYRNIANQYLSHRTIYSIDDINLSPIEAVNEMLIADKVQNLKDFMLYHYYDHPRTKELQVYFTNWLDRLNITNERYLELVKLIS